MAGEAWRSDWSALFIGAVIGTIIIILFPSHRATQSSPVMGAGASEIYADEKVAVFKIQDGKCTIYIAGRTYGSDGVALQLGEGCK